MSNADLVHEQRITIRNQRLTIHKQRVRIAELEYLLARYEETEEEEDVLENYEPRAIVVIVTEGKYEPTVKGPFPSMFKAEDWANAYEPQAGEVVHVLETEQP